MKTINKSCFVWLKIALLVFVSLLSQPPFVSVQADDDDDEFEEGQVVVKLDPSSGATIEDINATYNTTTLEVVLASRGIYLLEIAPGQNVEDVLEAMEDDPRLLYVEPNFISEAPEANPSETWAWGGLDPGPMIIQYAAAMLNLAAAHTVTLGAGVVVAVIDTGVQLDHPGLADHLTTNGYDFVDDDAIADDAFNGLDDDDDGLIDEGAGHGSHIAGIVNLVAPQAEIMPLRVLDSDGRGNIFFVAEAILHALQNGADVINLSLGTAEATDLLEDMVEDAVESGVIVVASAGNLNSSSEQYPAAEDDTIAVTAIGPEAKKSPFANYGPWVDIAAPGESIFSAMPIDGYAQWSGTSMATAFVTGQAALIRSVFPSLPVADVSQRIQATAQPIDEVNPGYQGLLGAGLADIGASVSQPGVSPDVLYVSSSANGTAGGVLSFRDEDILAFDAGAGLWSMYFDGSDVGLGATDIDAFEFMPDGAILLSLDSSSFKVPGVGSVDDSDIVKFIPTAVGENTAGTFVMYLDGSDVGLASAAEDIDAIGLMPDGQLVISTLGNFNVGVMGKDKDLLRFTALSLGWHSQGNWSMHFDGSDVDLTTQTEDVWGAWLDSATGEIYLSTAGPFSVTGSSGDGADIFICDPASVGDNTACTFGPGLYWDGSANGLAGKTLDGIFIARHP